MTYSKQIDHIFTMNFVEIYAETEKKTKHIIFPIALEFRIISMKHLDAV